MKPTTNTISGIILLFHFARLILSKYQDQFEPCYDGIDVSFIGLELSNQELKIFNLFPYPKKDSLFPMSSKGTNLRVAIVDQAIKKAMEL